VPLSCLPLEVRYEVGHVKLIASAIVHNEANRYLGIWLDHLLRFCDEVRVVDDASGDDTRAILDRERVHVLTNERREFFVHEGRARQRLLEWTWQSLPDYVLSIDADEFVGDPNALRVAMRRGAPVYTLQMEEVWRADEERLFVRTDNQWRPRPCPILWRAPASRDPSLWSIPNVQLACGREPIAVRRTRARVSGSSVFHFGWANQSERPARAERYFEHDKGRFHKDAHLQSILWGDDRVGVTPRPWPDSLREQRQEIVDRASRCTH
jgi:glycosyltransferase involved in cell wall biosynthesis